MIHQRSATVVAFINLILVVVANILTFWTWYNVFAADADTMFLGLLLIALLIVTVYYLVLLTWGIKLARTKIDPRLRFMQSFILFIMNVVPIAVIYNFTS